jgi:hypothetical protein|tara:strand:+ start:18513 stop:18782 length:270 start_codon:yes stop_codon:yes gene_type:complete
MSGPYTYEDGNWNPELLYRASRTGDQTASVLEEYAERNILTLLRTYFPEKNPNNARQLMPNYDYGPIVELATRLNKTIVSTLTTSRRIR